MPKTPSFRYMGGKARLRKWLLENFPKTGRNYVEPFAGLGNVFFQARKTLKFNHWFLSDLDASFLYALVECDLDELPERVSKQDFLKWKESGGVIAKIIEPKITFAGKGYKAGFDGGHESHPPYNGKLHRVICEEAKVLLERVDIQSISWDERDYSQFDERDFVYLDPPYFGTKSPYPNIDHEKLIELLNGSNFRWSLSGYDNELYQSSLKFVTKKERDRNSEIKGSNTGKYESVRETLWSNWKAQ